MAKKIASISKECVACGCCAKVCPIGAVAIHKGKRAVVNRERCVGCGKCAAVCPADVIAIVEREATMYA